MNNCGIVDYNDASQVQNCDFWGLPDLDHSQPAVRAALGALLSNISALGAVRVDAARTLTRTNSARCFAARRHRQTGPLRT